MNTKQFPESQYSGITSLNGVELHDVFMRSTDGYEYTLELVKCTHLTAKQATIGGIKYRIEDGRPIGRSTWDRKGSLQNYNHGEYTANGFDRDRRTARNRLSGIRWKSVPDEAVDAVWKIMKPIVEPKP